MWKGQPKGKIFTWTDLYFIPFSILWCSFAIFWEVSALVNDPPLIFKIWGVPFVLFGMYFTIGRFFYKTYINRNTYYYVTNQRVVIIKKTLRQKTTALYLSELHIIHKSANSKGAGKIRFGESAGLNAMYENTGLDFFGRNTIFCLLAKSIPLTFYYLEDANLVYHLICDAKANESSGIMESIAHK